MIVYDERKHIVHSETSEEAVEKAINHFLDTAIAAIEKKDSFYAALSGGSTPKNIFKGMVHHPKSKEVSWNKVFIFWSDERCVSPESDESNYKMAMEHGLGQLPIPKENIHRMRGEIDPEEAADEYEALILATVPHETFDVIMLGMGSDGHTASLFPDTEALAMDDRLVVANWVSKFDSWRLTFTFTLINKAKETNLYVLGKPKQEMIKKIFSNGFIPPVARVGTAIHPSIWFVDDESCPEEIFNKQ